MPKRDSDITDELLHAREELHALQLIKLRRLCEWAYATTPFHQRRFDAAGFHPEQIQTLDDTLVLKDASMELDLYLVKDNVHAGTLLMGYVPRDRMLIQADLYDAGWLQHPWGDSIKKNVELRKLKVDRDVPIHGPIQSYADVLKTIQSKQTAQTN